MLSKNNNAISRHCEEIGLLIQTSETFVLPLIPICETGLSRGAHYPQRFSVLKISQLLIVSNIIYVVDNGLQLLVV